MVARRIGGAALVGVLALVACGESDDDGRTDDDQSGARAGNADALAGEVRVFAAASLTDVFEEMAAVFEQENPEAHVTFSFAGSSALVTQVAEGAPADVLATASQSTMDDAVDAHVVSPDQPEVFARNALVLVTPAGNPAGVTGLADLADGARLVGSCAEDVPCGVLAAEVLDDAGVTPAVDTYEPDVRSLLTKLASGDLDAGLVYRSDAVAAGDDVEVVEVPGLDDSTTSYPIATVADVANTAAADGFVDLVMDEDGQAILAEAGFLPADPDPDS